LEDTQKLYLCGQKCIPFVVQHILQRLLQNKKPHANQNMV